MQKRTFFRLQRAQVAAGVALWLGLGLAATQAAQANDHIFPAAPAAKASVDFDSHGFLINGKRTFIASAGMEYARVPHALWRDRLLRLKRAGFNCVEMYNFWDWHEPQEGKFDFSGDHDLDAYLKLVHQMGMYAICRVGPYYCAEWDFGGYPLWLKFKPGLHVRQDEPQFEAAVDQFFDKLMPIVAANQINRGGSVILVQLENEGAGWGTDEPNPFFKHLQAKALSLGLQVPYFFSGLHHGGDPGKDTAMDDPDRPNPWFTTEFWSVWYNKYGSTDQDAATYDRRTWKIIAHGGNGYNYYMAHGGSNFAYTNDDEDAASYDYGAAVGQAGDLRPIFYTFKRAALFARSFQDILENSSDATSAYQGLASNEAIHVTARKSPAGTLVFLDNPGGSPVQTQVNAPSGSGLPLSGTLTLAPGEIMPLVQDFPVTPGVTLQWAPARVFGLVPQGGTTTLVVSGPSGSPAELHFTVPASATIQEGAADLKPGAAGTLVLNTPIPAGDPAEYVFTTGGRRVRILVLSDTRAARTWFVDAGGQTDVVVGPSFVGDADLQGGRLHLTTERPWQDAADLPTLVYGPTGPPLRLAAAPASPTHPATPTLSPWQARDASQPAQPNYDDHAWLASAEPLQMGADGDLSADAWYRATLTVPAAGKYSLHTAGAGDRAIAYVDGVQVGAGSLHGGDLPMTLPAGKHTLAIFTAHDGRAKLFGYTGPVDVSDPKGLMGPAVIHGGSGAQLTGWRVLKAAGGDDVKSGPPTAAAGWRRYTVGRDAFNKNPGFAWFQTTIPAATTDGAAHPYLHFDSVDDNGTVFVNGKQVATHQGYDSSFDVPLAGALTTGTPAVVTVFVENTDGTGGLDGPVTLTASTGNDATVTDWKLRGGPGDPLSEVGWKPLGTGDSFAGPAFFRATFTAAPPAALGPHPIWRVLSTGLGHGSVWVNGHNLGRYPERIPVNGLYIPESWLISGRNSLVIYDEDGRRPDQVTVAAETAASRDVVALASAK